MKKSAAKKKKSAARKKLKKRVKHWVLKEKDHYFHMWTGIGPKATQKLEEAAQFSTKNEAMQSPAFSFSLTFYEPHPVR